MQQIYHSSATTNINIRNLIQNNSVTNSELASRFNVSQNTISKLKNGDFVQDVSCKPHSIKFALTDIAKAVIISLRRSTWLLIDEVWEFLLEGNNSISRSSGYHCFVKENIKKYRKKKEILPKNLKHTNQDIYI